MRGKLSPRSTGRAQVEKYAKNLVSLSRNRCVSIQREFADCLPLRRSSPEKTEDEKARERSRQTTLACSHRSRAKSLHTTLLASPPPEDDLHARIRHSRPRRDPLARARAASRRASQPRSGALGNQNPRALFVGPSEATPARCAHGRDRCRRALERSRSRRGSETLLERSPGDGAVERPPRGQDVRRERCERRDVSFFPAKRRPPERSKRENGPVRLFPPFPLARLRHPAWSRDGPQHETLARRVSRNRPR